MSRPEMHSVERDAPRSSVGALAGVIEGVARRDDVENAPSGRDGPSVAKRLFRHEAPKRCRIDSASRIPRIGSPVSYVPDNRRRR